MHLRARLQSILGSEYDIERELGGAGMSRVFVATEKRLARRVVIKVLSTEIAASLSTERFEREIQLAASLQQANIVPVLSAGEVQGSPYYTMPFVEGESLMMGMKELAVSSGSACTSASLEPSYVLKAIGVGEDLAHTSIRFGLGRFTTQEEIEFATQKVVSTVKKLRDLSPLYEMVKEGIDLKSINWTGH